MFFFPSKRKTPEAGARKAKESQAVLDTMNPQQRAGLWAQGNSRSDSQASASAQKNPAQPAASQAPQTQVYVMRGNQQFGPYTVEQIRTYLLEGQLSSCDLGWKEGMKDWTPLEKLVPRLSAVPVPSRQSRPSSFISSPPSRRIAIISAWLAFGILILLGILVALRRMGH
jgi:hypothetical protein